MQARFGTLAVITTEPVDVEPRVPWVAAMAGNENAEPINAAARTDTLVIEEFEFLLYPILLAFEVSATDGREPKPSIFGQDA